MTWNLPIERPNALRSCAYCERLVEHPLGARHAARGADQPLALELPHDVVEALADLAEHGVRRHAHVLEGQQRGVGRVHAELLQALLADHARQVHVDQEEREAVVARVGVGLGHEHDVVGAVAVGDVGLRPVDHILVAVAHSVRLDAGDVGAGVRLGDAEAGDLLALDRGHEVALLLLLGAEQRGSAASPCRCGPRCPCRARRSCACDHLLGEHEVAEVVAALPAVLLGIGQAEEAELAHAAEDGVRERRLLPLLRVRRELLDHERVDRLAQRFVLIVEDEVLAARPVVGLQHIGLGGGHI